MPTQFNGQQHTLRRVMLAHLISVVQRLAQLDLQLLYRGLEHDLHQAAYKLGAAVWGETITTNLCFC